jgi:transposase
MDGSIQLSARDRKTLFQVMHTDGRRRRQQHAHILLLLHDRVPWRDIVALLYTSSRTINRCRRRFLAVGIASVTGSAPAASAPFWVAWMVAWVLERAPADFGFVRSRWTCELVAIVLRDDHQVTVSRETVRRWLHRRELAFRRPRPTLRPKDPAYRAKLARIKRLLRDLPPRETAVFMDEVDVNTNPKIGSMWMRRGAQTTVLTPGSNDKRYLAGSQHWRTGRLLVSAPGRQRNGALFLAHLDHLRRSLRQYRVIHVILDNARFHKPEQTRAVHAYLQQWGHRVKLHFLPTYAPQTNPIERVWWHLHEEVTRNHRCTSIDELLDQVFDWLGLAECFPIETSIYTSNPVKHAAA